MIVAGAYFALGWFALLGAFVASPGFNHRYSMRSHTNLNGIQFAYDTARDPRIGDVLELGELPAANNDHPGPVLIVAMGDCQGCSSNVFKPNLLEVGSYSRIILVHSGEEEENWRLRVPDDERFTIISDPRRMLHSSLNAAWTPRFYICSNDLTLLAIQTTPYETPDFVVVRESDRAVEIENHAR